jgi:hypothetical protein
MIATRSRTLEAPTIALPASAVAKPRAYRKVQLELRNAAGLGKAPDDALVFGHYTGEPRRPNATTKDG